MENNYETKEQPPTAALTTMGALEQILGYAKVKLYEPQTIDLAFKATGLAAYVFGKVYS